LACVAFLLICFLIEIIKKIYMAKVIEIRLRKLHKIIFEKLLNANLDYFLNTNIADILNWFTTNFTNEFAPYLIMIKSGMIIIISTVLLVLINYWITIAIFLILVSGQIFSIHHIFKNRIKLTLKYFYLVEYESRKRMFSYVINNLRGRSVVQSFDRVSEFCVE
jgi:ABC-type multidrug transport system fused ATPase/permease subunit